MVFACLLVGSAEFTQLRGNICPHQKNYCRPPKLSSDYQSQTAEDPCRGDKGPLLIIETLHGQVILTR
jgi:hypothetical protein